MTHTHNATHTTTAPEDSSGLPTQAITHPKCGKWWTGLGRSHCPACCITFSCDSAADKHRTGTHGTNRHCIHPTEAGLVARTKPYGDLWGWPTSSTYNPATRREN